MFVLLFHAPPNPSFSLDLLHLLLPRPRPFTRRLSVSLSLRFSASRRPSEARRDVAEEDLPGLHRHQHSQSSAAPWGPLELVSDRRGRVRHLLPVSSTSSRGDNYCEDVRLFSLRVKFILREQLVIDMETLNGDALPMWSMDEWSNYESRGIVDLLTASYSILVHQLFARKKHPRLRHCSACRLPTLILTFFPHF